jgi:hypothetical protein
MGSQTATPTWRLAMPVDVDVPAKTAGELDSGAITQAEFDAIRPRRSRSATRS